MKECVGCSTRYSKMKMSEMSECAKKERRKPKA